VDEAVRRPGGGGRRDRASVPRPSPSAWSRTPRSASALVFDRRLSWCRRRPKPGPRWRPHPRDRESGCRSRPAHHHERGVAPVGDLHHEGVAARSGRCAKPKDADPGGPDAAAQSPRVTPSVRRDPDGEPRPWPGADHLGRDVDIADPDVERPGRPAAVAGRVDGGDREPVRPATPSLRRPDDRPFRRSGLISWRPPTTAR
jgi:hypothetical protein